MNRNELVNAIELATEIEQATSLDEIFARLQACLTRYGFTACLVTNLPVQHDKRWYKKVLINGWPSGWYQRYTSVGHYQHDPCAARSRNTARPFIWSDVRDDQLQTRAQLVMDEAGEFGLREGICVPIHAPFTVPAVVTVSGEAVDLTPATRYAVHALAQHAYHAAARVFSDGSVSAVAHLTRRERDILQWVAVGKTAWEASCILGISETTVITHLRNAKEKLDTANVVHTVVEALRRQEIQL